MNTAEFWTLIDKAAQKSSGDVERLASILVAALIKKGEPEIRDFAGHFNECMKRSYLPSLHCAAGVMLHEDEGDVSDDMFEYFRAWLITLGQARFEAAISNPDSIAAVELEDPVEECSAGELLLSVPSEALMEACGEEDPDLVELDVVRPALHTLGPEPDDPARTFPELWKRYRSAGQ